MINNDAEPSSSSLHLIRRGAKRRPVVLAWAMAVLATVLASTAALNGNASADASGCTTAKGGSVCIWVVGKGEVVREITVARFKGWEMCQQSAWVYAVLPNGGGVITLDYQARSNCSYGSTYFHKRFGTYSYSGKYLPHGSRVCVKWMENGASVGGEPCVTIYR
jgi:hypothetical protein